MQAPLRSLKSPLNLLALAFLATACPLNGDLGDYTATGSSAGDSSSTTTLGSTSDTTGTTDAPSTGAPPDSSTTDDQPAPICDPIAKDVAVTLSVDAPTLLVPDQSPELYELDCTVTSEESPDIITERTIELSCAHSDDLEIHSVVIHLETSIAHTGLLGGETDVRLRMRHGSVDPAEFGFEWGTHLSLHSKADDALLLLFAGGYDAFDPQLADFWAPLQISEGEPGACEIETDAPPWSPCYTRQRFPINVDIGAGQGPIPFFDHTAALFGPENLWMYVETAGEMIVVKPEVCTDNASGRVVEVLVLRADG